MLIPTNQKNTILRFLLASFFHVLSAIGAGAAIGSLKCARDNQEPLFNLTQTYY